MCGDLLELAQQRKWVREGRELLRKRERGYGEPAGGVDVFAGMRGEVMSESLTVAREDAQVAAVMPREQAGMLAMATMSGPEFEQRIKALKVGQERIKRIKQELMEDDTHYGVIPGTKKPTLLKPGAEVLCSIYGLRPDFLPTITPGDGITAPHLRVTMRCELHLGDITGPVVAVGYGSANSWERRHRYRRGERVCPTCGVVGQVIKGKDEYGGGWLCWKKNGGCGAKFADGAPEIEGQQVGDVENPDPYDLENTLVKMSKKRAHIDAALTGTASSDLFTQDLDEGGPSEKDHHAPKAGGAKPQTPPRSKAVAGSGCPHCGSANLGPTPDKKPGWQLCGDCKKASKIPPGGADPAYSGEPWDPEADEAGARG